MRNCQDLGAMRFSLYAQETDVLCPLGRIVPELVPVKVEAAHTWIVWGGPEGQT